MTQATKTYFIATVLLALLALKASVYVVNEGEKAIKLRLGEIISAPDGKPRIYDPGLHFKWPLINNNKFFDTRIQGLKAEPFLVLTSQQTFLKIDYYAQWRIMDLAQFYTSTGGSYARAEQLLEQKINDAVRAEIGRRTSNEVISSERDQTMVNIRDRANRVVNDSIGVQLVDVRLESIQLPPKVMTSVFNRMAAERKQFAEFKRAEGTKTAEGIRALADQRSVVIKAEAKTSAATTKAEGEREAARIYAEAYGKNAEFFNFWRSLQAYQFAFASQHGALVLKPDSQFFKYFNSPKAGGGS